MQNGQGLIKNFFNPFFIQFLSWQGEPIPSNDRQLKVKKRK
jgi:hypothetical protein